MRQGDSDWQRLSAAIAIEDALRANRHNDSARPEHRLHLSLGPVPCTGAIMTAPIVLLLGRPVADARSTALDYTFAPARWPLAALHPQAPAALGEWWGPRLESLVHLFGAQHVANSVAAIYLTPWLTTMFDERLRLPSRARLLDLAAAAASRDAILIMMQGSALWTEHPVIASLPPARLVSTKSWRSTELSRRNLGGDLWDIVRKRVEVHAWI
ncbi:MAG TPA: hypothetical protein VJX31_12620 [Casimicrobiaceae bacterium]|nr:hypothetical protein [Casimicrobiaceae bacterium]